MGSDFSSFYINLVLTDDVTNLPNQAVIIHYNDLFALCYLDEKINEISM